MIQHILIIRFRRVGDSVLSMALCHSLRQSFPQAKIHFVINKHIAPLYRNHPDIDKVIPFSDRENKGMTYLKKVWAIMHQTPYDVIIDMRSTPKTLPFALFSLHSAYRIGRHKWYNHFIHNFRIPESPQTNRVQSNLALMEPLGQEGNLIRDEHFPLYVSEEERQTYANYLTSKGITFSRPIVLLAVATRIEGKAWPKERMQEVLSRLITHYSNAQFIMNYGGNAEKALCQSYYDALGQPCNLFMNVEAPTLRDLVCLCSLSQFFFGNEGGPRHIRQAMGVPSFAIYPPNIDKHFWLPGNSANYQGISPDEFVSKAEQQKMTYQERMQLITIDAVWQQLSSMLNCFFQKEP